MLTSWLLFLSVLVANPEPTTPLVAPAPPPVFELLDGGKDEELAELSPKVLLKELKKGRKFGKVSTERKRALRDGFDRTTDLYVVVPPKPRGVLFLLHGLGGNGRQLIEHFEPWAKSRGLIIAAPTAKKPPKAPAANEDWSQTSAQLPHWWSYRPEGFVLTALSSLKKQYPIDENQVYLSGYSMGGFGTWNLGLRYPDRFAALVPMAGGISQREYMLDDDPQIRALLDNSGNTPVYILHGDRDNTVDVKFDRKSRDRLRELKHPHEYVEVPGGGHLLDVRNGTPLMKGVQSWADKQKRDPHPKRIRFHSLGDYMNQCYWVRIDERHEEGPASVTAQIGKSNKVVIETENVKKLTVFVDEKLLKIKRAISVTVDGKRRFKKKVKASSETIIESWRAREDRELLYAAKIEIELDAKKAKK